MSKPGSIDVGPTGNQDVDGVLWGTKWDTTTLTFSMPQTADVYGYNSITGFQHVTDNQTNAIIDILHDIGTFSGLNFLAVNDSDAALRFGRATALDIDGTNASLDTAEGHAPDPESYLRRATSSSTRTRISIRSPAISNMSR